MRKGAELITTIHSNFYADEMLAEEFFELQRLVFPGLDLKWAYQHELISPQVIPWGVFDKNKALSILNATQMQVITRGQTKRALQIGTVATHPDYCGLGFSRKILQAVLRQSDDFFSKRNLNYISLFALVYSSYCSFFM